MKLKNVKKALSNPYNIRGRRIDNYIYSSENVDGSYTISCKGMDIKTI